jgi:hypothetical protein
MCERPGRGGAPRAWQVARRSSAERRTTRRNGSSAGSPGGIAGMEHVGRSWSACPISPVRTSSHFTLAFDFICAPQLSEEVVYLVTKESLYSGAIGIPTASPARAARRLSRLSTVFYGSISFTVTNRGRVAIDRTSNTDRESSACESDVLQVFLLPQPRRGRCGRWLSRALLMACDPCRWIAPIRNAPTRSLARRTPPRPYQLCRQGRSASSTQAIQCRLP